MERGLYEQLVTEGLRRRLAAIAADEARTRPVDSGDQPHVLARHIEAAVQTGTGRYSATRNDGSPSSTHS